MVKIRKYATATITSDVLKMRNKWLKSSAIQAVLDYTIHSESNVLDACALETFTTVYGSITLPFGDSTSLGSSDRGVAL